MKKMIDFKLKGDSFFVKEELFPPVLRFTLTNVPLKLIEKTNILLVNGVLVIKLWLKEINQHFLKTVFDVTNYH